MTARQATIGDVYAGRRVLVTGHTGFKGSWLCLWLAELGAEVAGFSDRIPTTPSAYDAFGAGAVLRDERGDVRDVGALGAAIAFWRPEIVFHLAAQPIVRVGLKDPVETFAVNVIGTAAVLEAVRNHPFVRAVLVVTSDKVYANEGTRRAFVETDPLGGHEPYGASKAAAEIVAACHRSAGFHRGACSTNVAAVATARAGNVIGGGDWAPDRLIPDAARAVLADRPLVIRSPRATRPWQHVLEPVGGYLLHGRALLLSPDSAPAAVNFGPATSDTRTVGDVAQMFLDAMAPRSVELVIEEDRSGAEATALMVDSGLAARTLSWTPTWDAATAVRRSAEWYAAHAAGAVDLSGLARKQLDSYRAESPTEALRA